MECYVVKDLLANYLDGLNSEETTNDIKEHLASCGECCRLYEKMAADNFKPTLTEDKNIDFLKKLRGRILRKNLLVAVIVCIAVLGTYIFAKQYKVSIPFDKERILVELFSPVDVTGGIVVEQENSIDVVEVVCREADRTSGSLGERIVSRDGENVKMVYCCFTKTLWDRLFFGEKDGEETSFICFNRYDETYSVQKIEVYYVSIENMEKGSGLSDEEFVAMLEEEGILIWKGSV